MCVRNSDQYYDKPTMNVSRGLSNIEASDCELAYNRSERSTKETKNGNQNGGHLEKHPCFVK